MKGPTSLYARMIKRGLDLVVAAILVSVTAPLLFAVAFTIRLTSPGPAFFRQVRLGRNGTTFEALKFRTMYDRARTPDTVRFTGGDAEITPIGRLLRRSKLDELPQLINVLRGEMSLVGPRPQLPVQLDDFDDNARMRLLVRPGLTGMAQTHGNVELTWPERWYWDAWYVRNLTAALDLRLLIRTIFVLVQGESRFIQHPPAERASK